MDQKLLHLCHVYLVWQNCRAAARFRQSNKMWVIPVAIPTVTIQQHSKKAFSYQLLVNVVGNFNEIIAHW